ncbi:MAG TPA: RNA polymerase sigma factor [Chitinophagaceae bacterium]
MDEHILLEKLRQGDQAAFKEAVDTWQNMVYNTALGILQNAEDAEDVAQEVFVQVFESIHTFKGESKFSTWLYRITVTKSLDHLRKKKRKKRFAYVQSIFGANNETIIDQPDFNHPGVTLDNKERANLLFRAIRELPENQRIAFTLHKLEGLSYQEVSDAMKTTVSSVESLMHRAKNNLKKWLTVHYRNES